MSTLISNFSPVIDIVDCSSYEAIWQRPQREPLEGIVSCRLEVPGSNPPSVLLQVSAKLATNFHDTPAFFLFSLLWWHLALTRPRCWPKYPSEPSRLRSEGGLGSTAFLLTEAAARSGITCGVTLHQVTAETQSDFYERSGKTPASSLFQHFNSEGKHACTRHRGRTVLFLLGSSVLRSHLQAHGQNETSTEKTKEQQQLPPAASADLAPRSLGACGNGLQPREALSPEASPVLVELSSRLGSLPLPAKKAGWHGSQAEALAPRLQHQDHPRGRAREGEATLCSELPGAVLQPLALNHFQGRLQLGQDFPACEEHHPSFGSHDPKDLLQHPTVEIHQVATDAELAVPGWSHGHLVNRAIS